MSIGFACSSCGHGTTDVKDSRATLDGLSIRRRRCCPSCRGRFTTVELTVSETRSGVPLEGAGAATTTQLAQLLAVLAPDDARMLIGMARRLAPETQTPTAEVLETRPQRRRVA